MSRGGDAPPITDAVVVNLPKLVIEEDGVRIETLTAARYAAEHEVYDAFTSGKHCCCLFSLSQPESARKRDAWPASKRWLSAVAIDVATDAVIGTIQGVGFGDPCDMHTCKRGELHVEHLAVSAGARGKGVGTKLLRWMEAAARDRRCATLTLGVLRGNPAQRLYERFGFEVKRHDCCDEAVSCCFVTFVMGRPYGLCHASWGGDDMVKTLET